jgi:hypothetical protein
MRSKAITLTIASNYELNTRYSQAKENQIFFDGNFAAMSVKRK